MFIIFSKVWFSLLIFVFAKILLKSAISSSLSTWFVDIIYDNRKSIIILKILSSYYSICEDLPEECVGDGPVQLYLNFHCSLLKINFCSYGIWSRLLCIPYCWFEIHCPRARVDTLLTLQMVTVGNGCEFICEILNMECDCVRNSYSHSTYITG